MVPIFIFERPFELTGLDSALLQLTLGKLELLKFKRRILGFGPTPAFPTVLAWVQHMTNTEMEQAILILGHLSLFALFLGIWGSMDRLGAGASSVLAMGGSFALFAKVFDSGYPTVASQLGLIVGLMIVLRLCGNR